MNKVIKRLTDICVVTVALVFTVPVLLIVAVVIRFTQGPPILFRQLRPGLHGKPFIFHKFRTMTRDCDENGCLLSDECRLNKLGLFLRRTSIDELPQFWNVLKGDMSLVGPRPLLMEYLPLYTSQQARRHEVKPGITGWAQVHGRNAITWEDKFALDLWYVDNWSIWLDLKILVMTAVIVLKREGISQEGRATMEEFRGCDPGE